mmetsp:Transcript_25697/g.78097  ORF Transcript_25697/g.78097 Transcript_25697/m.78097 type:complete len:231 (+) Transcript_25697:1715-2407(+)
MMRATPCSHLIPSLVPCSLVAMRPSLCSTRLSCRTHTSQATASFTWSTRSFRLLFILTRPLLATSWPPIYKQHISTSCRPRKCRASASSPQLMASPPLVQRKDGQSLSLRARAQSSRIFRTQRQSTHRRAPRATVQCCTSTSIGISSPSPPRWTQPQEESHTCRSCSSTPLLGASSTPPGTPPRRAPYPSCWERTPSSIRTPPPRRRSPRSPRPSSSSTRPPPMTLYRCC